ncbi:hypothetical protein [Caulobacter endophyticus]|uniref:hypothetical protein n=1 Tax=Caulobacter endophyticus TaxID=2172652 RepID=UPI00240F3940|nr:hypothetical protein [Caulobacter endophyticus]MDG2528904.1 hypothetical protein [Caulobacter endophyticus]
MNPGSARGLAADTVSLRRQLSEGLKAEDLAAVSHAFRALGAGRRLDPKLSAAVGSFASRLGAPDLAEEAFRLALEERPDDPTFLHFRGLARLRAGRWRDGWRDCEARLDAHRLLPFSAMAVGGAPLPRWRAGEPPPARLLICTEQGAGDTIQFARFALRLMAEGVEVRVMASPKLAWLVRALGLPLVEPSPEGVIAVSVDAWCAMMSLPGLMGVETDEALSSPPYLARVGGEASGARSRPRIGLAWQGNPRHPNDAYRSIPPQALSPLLETEGYEFVSLQVADGVDQPPPANMAAGPQPGDKPFLAALERVSGTDLVVAIDSAVAHMAGAMGVPCALLLPPHHRDWRWERGATTSPWYDAVRIFRRLPTETWPSFVARVSPEVLALGRPS